MIRLILITQLLLFMHTHSASAQPSWPVPERLVSVTDKDYNLALKIIEETTITVAEDNGKIVYADYWNLAYAYALSKQPPEQVAVYLRKSCNLDPVKFAELLKVSTNTAKRFRNHIGSDVFADIVTLCQLIEPTEDARTEDTITDVTSYSDLQCLLLSILKDDQYARDIPDSEQQVNLDEKNLILIDELYAKHRTYIGINLVGRELAHVMWLVIQHSNISTMKRYLPVIRRATYTEQLPGGKGPIKLLVDRICAAEYGVQLYGTQIGVPLAGGIQARRMKKEYPLVYTD